MTTMHSEVQTCKFLVLFLTYSTFILKRHCAETEGVDATTVKAAAYSARTRIANYRPTAARTGLRVFAARAFHTP